MLLMNNKYFIFKRVKIGNNSIKNTTDLNLLPRIPDIFKGNDYIKELLIEDNTLIEQISYRLYDTTDYWDLLFVLNNMTNLNQLPKEEDIILRRADNIYKKWLEVNQSTVIYEDLNIEEKYKNILKEEEEKNEKYRYFKYISSSHISEVMNELKKIKEKGLSLDV